MLLAAVVYLHPTPNSAMAEPEISPTDLKFRFQLNKQLPTSISIHNPGSDRVAFKVKTTTPKKYVVRPSSGTVEPGSTSNVQVIMQAQKDFPADFNNCKDKFLVQTTYLAPDEEIGAETFKKEDRKDLRETRLRVILEGPPAPPSPVPEANENDEDGTVATRHQTLDEDPSDRTRAAYGDLASVTQENKTLRAKLDAMRIERDDYRNQLDKVKALGGGRVSKGASKLSLLYLILTAIIAFLLGHYT